MSGPGSPPAERVLTREILTVAAVVVLGSVTTVLDATIVNVALPTLGREFGASIATIQWVPTAYLLAFASVIPLTGWMAERFGATQVWLASLAAFAMGSLLCGSAQSVGQLIGFRVVQGLGGGLLMPIGQTLLAAAAGPRRMGRVMSIVGVPMLLAPIVGPVAGGALVGAVSWRWIFFVNLPVAALALALAVRLLPATPARGGSPLDVPGLVLLSGGIAVSVFGLAEVGARGAVLDAVPATALAAGLASTAAGCVRAARAAHPIVDVRLFARRGFGSAAATTLLLGVALFGVALLLPLYYQLVRGASALETGWLLVPQGLGAVSAMPVAGALTDRIGARPVVLAGIVLALAGTAGYARIGTDTSYAWSSGALLLVGAGLGATITPAMAVAFHDVDRAAIARASSAVNVVQRVAGSLGTALLAVVLQRAMRSDLPGFHGGIGQAAALAAADPGGVRPGLAAAFRATFWVAFALTAAALAPAAMLPGPVFGGHRRADGRD